MAADALERRQDFGNDAAAGIERIAQALFAFVEWNDPFLRPGDFAFDRADARSRIDELLIEFAPVVADRFNLPSQLGLILDRAFLIGLDGSELLRTLLECVEVRWIVRIGRRRRAGLRSLSRWR